jgi:hypothetical protein
MIGEDAVNRALRKVIAQYAYNAPPYPTSYALVDALREQTPPQYQYLIKDLFEDITLFSNRTTDASAVKRSDGKCDVTIHIEAHKTRLTQRALRPKSRSRTGSTSELSPSRRKIISTAKLFIVTA